VYRSTLYSHAPGRLEYRVRVPEAARLDVALGVLRSDVPVTFRVEVQEGESEAETAFERTVSDSERWHQHTVDLSPWGGRTVTFSLGADAERQGTVALWGAPTLGGARVTTKPNVIFYIIDAGGANYMSVYGYNRPTTPNMERLASDGVVFEHAYSNSTWSKTSTPSFATSLQHSVLGGYATETDPIPEQAVTMAERLHSEGYQTAVITSNAYAGTMTSMERGADLLRDAGVEPNSTSTLQLHDDFWSWRVAYPGEPYFVHFQTTDVHWPWTPPAPFAGSFVDPAVREQFYGWERQLARASGRRRPGWLGARTYPDSAYEKTGIDKNAFYNAGRGLYDEAMAHQDHQLGQLVERLKARGEWEQTLLIVAADHGNNHGLGLFDSIPRWRPMFDSYLTRIPLIVVWPERITGGRRLSEPVSMIDMLPTILDLADLPSAEVAMGQSLGPLLLGEPGWEPRPVIFDEFYVDRETGELEGTIEVIDGRWGASLSIRAESAEGADADEPRRPRLLLYDLWNDPYLLHSLHEERADLVEKYTDFLEAQWEAHQALAQRFDRSGEVTPLTPEQLRTLQSLGYIN
jgi:arylsulfatase A-like enzyme